MTATRRNIVSSQRLALLREPGAVYAISCGGSHCHCPDFGAVCRRGFFSLWIQAIYGLYFANHYQVPGYVDFGNRAYLYSDPHKFPHKMNMWDYYYRQQEPLSTDSLVRSNFVEDYPLRIWQKDHFQNVHQAVIANLQLQPEVASYISTLQQRCQAGRTLGLQIRLTDHPEEIEPVSLDQYLRIMQQCTHRYDFFFIATDDMRVIELLVKEWGPEKIIIQQAVRSQSTEAVHTNMGHKNRYQLGLEVLADCYALSVCEMAVLVHSNISYGALLLNPQLPYRLLETKGSMISRWKTSLLYKLDQWGIRKM